MTQITQQQYDSLIEKIANNYNYSMNVVVENIASSFDLEQDEMPEADINNDMEAATSVVNDWMNLHGIEWVEMTDEEREEEEEQEEEEEEEQDLVNDEIIVNGSHYRKAKYRVDSHELRYTGYDKIGDYWNGWNVPFFTKETCDKIIEDMNKFISINSPEHYTINWDNKTYTEHSTERSKEEEEEEWTFKMFTIVVNDITYYSLGGWNWTWIDE